MEKLWQKYVCKKGINEGRIVLHSDLNNFFASVECKNRPDLAGLPVAVCGNKEDRHGIVLAKNELAKRSGVKTAEPIWQAKQKCSSLVVVKPHYEEYSRYSSMVKSIYLEYTDRVESFGMDEAWLELTGDCRIKTLQQGRIVAEEIRKRVKSETGLTVSIGVSDNKIFSKLASDYKKPDAVTLFCPENYEDVVSGLDIGEILFVGANTKKLLFTYGLHTIGDVAKSSDAFMKAILGKNGMSLYANASGANIDIVKKYTDIDDAKSVGNSVTLPKDLTDEYQVKGVLCALAEKVAYRLRCAELSCSTIAVSVRNPSLVTIEKQAPIAITSNAVEIARAAYELYVNNYDVALPVRSVGIRTAGLVSSESGVQIDMFDTSFMRSERLSKIDEAADVLRQKYGVDIIGHVSAMHINIMRHNATSFARGL